MDTISAQPETFDQADESGQLAERVLRGMAKWPNVPSVYNWLQLDRRGHWLMKGSEVTHPRLLAFINQHYLAAADGSYYFQNGPQQVFIQLALAPYVFSPLNNQLISHNDKQVGAVEAAYLSDQGDLLLQTDIGPGVIDDRYLAQVEEWFQVEGDRDSGLADLLDGRQNSNARLVSKGFNIDLPLKPLAIAQLESTLGFIANPQPPADGGEYCVE
ncbi:MAG: DUF2946 family protein [Gammaproteobacteria bacterium]